MGIEPMSESISIGASPSAAYVLTFAFDSAHKQALPTTIL